MERQMNTAGQLLLVIFSKSVVSNGKNYDNPAYQKFRAESEERR
jgi:hypothetical protein